VAPGGHHYRYLLPAGTTAANLPQQHAEGDSWDRQMDKHHIVT